VYLKAKILILFLFIRLSLSAQQFIYQYIDPCTKEIKTIYADMSSPIMVSYYGQTNSFTYQQLQDGTFDSWMDQTYNTYKGVNPCQGLITTTTTTTSTNLVSNTVGLVMNLNSITNLDFSNLGSGIGTDVAGNTSSGSSGVNANKERKKDQNNQSNEAGSNSSSSSSSSKSDNSGESGSGSGSESGSTGSGNSSGSSGDRSGGNSGNKEDKNKPSEEKIEETKQEEQKNSAGQTTKAANRSKTETQKPAILVTGDVVGIQSASSSSQDARATSSFTRVKGDGTASLGGSIDYTFNARIGNITLVRSWIGSDKKGNKHINVLSDGFSFLPGTVSNTLLFVRVNSLKNFTALYGGAATYGKMYGEELISTLAVGGFMYKGKITKKINGTFIAASIYSPYSKYYTESFMESKPIIIPFMNLTYQMTKTFGAGLTAGGTYVAGQDVLNYQVLLGAKLIL